MHTPYECGFAWNDMVHGCMVYTEIVLRGQQFHAAPAMPAQWILKKKGKKIHYKKLVTHVDRRIALYEQSSINQLAIINQSIKNQTLR